MKTVVMPGSFDPFTVGHLDILVRACALFDFVYVGVLSNCNKKAWFTPQERVEMINKTIAANGIVNASAECFSGMLVDFIRQKNACGAVRGIRSGADFENEITMFDINSMLENSFEAVTLFAKPQLACVSSSAVKEICTFGGDVSRFVPDEIYKQITERIGNRNE